MRLPHHPDDFVCVDCHVLHDARTGARDWEGKGAADVVRPDANPASLSEALMAEAKKTAALEPQDRLNFLRHYLIRP